MTTISEAAKLLLSQNFITLLCHCSPDGDTTGSAAALLEGLTQLGKTARMRCADPYPPDIAGLLEIPPPGDWQEQFIVAVDVADQKLLGSLEAEYAGRVDLVIDHHPSNTGYGKATCLNPAAAATTELVAELLAALGVTLTPAMATAIYVGLATDSGCFRFASTTAATLRTAANMLEAGVDAGQINQLLFETKKPGRVALECRVLEQIEYSHNGHCAFITLPLGLPAQYGVAENDLDGIASLARQIEGVWVGVTIREQEDGLCRVSVRTTKEANSSAICAAFDGGGHLRAGGCTILGNAAQAKALLQAEITRQLGDCP